MEEKQRIFKISLMAKLNAKSSRYDKPRNRGRITLGVEKEDGPPIFSI